MAEDINPQDLEAARIVEVVVKDIETKGPIFQVLAPKIIVEVQVAIERGGPLPRSIRRSLALLTDRRREGQQD
jgi:hypothetical protein